MKNSFVEFHLLFGNELRGFDVIELLLHQSPASFHIPRLPQIKCLSTHILPNWVVRFDFCWVQVEAWVELLLAAGVRRHLPFLD